MNCSSLHTTVIPSPNAYPDGQFAHGCALPEGHVNSHQCVCGITWPNPEVPEIELAMATEFELSTAEREAIANHQRVRAYWIRQLRDEGFDVVRMTLEGYRGPRPSGMAPHALSFSPKSEGDVALYSIVEQA